MKRVVLLLVLLFATASAARAQQQTGEIFGKAADQSGAIMPGVTVTATSSVLLQPLVAVTSDTGTYRFPQIPIGTYTVTFELSGFATVVRENIRIEIGFNAQINAEMSVGGITETLQVTASSPLVDIKDTGRSTRFNQEALQSIPTARDPWVIIEQSAGVAMDRQNVGGSMSGQQSNFVARGASMFEQKWNLDGVDITDMNATGGSPVYYDFDAFEEMQISTGGNDVTMQSPGVAVNLVTKSGTDKYRGAARYYITDDNFESVNLTDQLRTAGATSGNPIQNIKDWGAEIGGPIAKSKAWFWGSWGRQDVGVGVNGFYQPTAACQQLKADLKANPLSHSVEDTWNCLNTDLTELKNGNAKLTAALTNTNTASFYFNYSGKIRNARDASDTRPIETTLRQGGVTDTSLGSALWKTGVPKTYKWSDRHVFSDRFLVEAQYAHIGNNFALDFHDPSLSTVQIWYDQNTGMYGRSYYAQQIVRPTDSIDVTGNYFLPGTLGGDNAMKFGMKIRNDEGYTGTHYGGNAYSVFTNGVPYQAWVMRDSATDYILHNRNVYFQDTWTRKRLTINAGVRFDYQSDYAGAASVGAVPFYGQTTRYGQVFNQLPAATFAGYTPAAAFKDLSPRAGASYDVMGDGKTVFKFNYSRYVSQIGGNTTGYLSNPYNPVKVTEVDYPWSDLNNDGFVQANEIDMRGAPAFATAGYDYNNPTLMATTGTTDPNLTSPKTDEFLFTFDRQVMDNLAVSATYIYRKYTNFTWTMRPGLTANDWTAKTYTPNCSTAPSGALCQPVTYYAPNFQMPVNTVLTNEPDYYRTFNGIELAARKRMAKDWQMNASFSYNNAKQYYPTPASYGPQYASDPTNIAFYSGAQYAQQSTSSGLDNVFVNTPWIFRVSGSYTTPWQKVNVAGFYNTRAGYPFEQIVQTTSRGGGAAAAGILLSPIGDTRLPTFQNFDFRIDKPFTFGTTKIIASMDIFNLFNENTILAENRTQNSATANTIKNILAPRVIRFGARITF
jgi:hypothetical protein